MVMSGLLWFDDDAKRPLVSKIDGAASRYVSKHGHAPTVCYVHPSAFDDSELKPGDAVNHQVNGEWQEIKVLPDKSMLPYHFWLGMMDKPKEKAKPAQSQ